MSDNYIVINGKRLDLTNEQLKQLGIASSNNSRWRANDGYYWFVTSDGILCDTWDNEDDEHTFRFYSHNYFETEEEASKYARVLNTEMLLMKYADEHNEKEMPPNIETERYFICWDFTCDEIRVKSMMISMIPRVVYFSSDSIAHNAIDAIGADRITEYLTYEW